MLAFESAGIHLHRRKNRVMKAEAGIRMHPAGAALESIREPLSMGPEKPDQFLEDFPPRDVHLDPVV
jgi:hypothetical protein